MGTVVGIRSAFNPVQVIRQFHVDVLLGRPGQVALGVTAILLVLATVSGVVLWWPSTGKFRQAVTVKARARGHRLHVDLHRVTGFYLLIPFFTASFTGIVIVWPQQTFPALSWPVPIPERAKPPPKRSVASDVWIDVDQAVAVGLGRLGQRSLSYVALPTLRDPFYRVTVRGFVNAEPGFGGIGAVIDGASELFIALFGESGRHARTAIGVAALPRNALVEVDAVFRVTSGP